MEQWFDTRIKNPSPNGYDIYTVIILKGGDFPVIGRAAFKPQNNYTSGKWEKVVDWYGASYADDSVLYWTPNIHVPKFVMDMWRSKIE
jgi:hypothetical protein